MPTEIQDSTGAQSAGEADPRKNLSAGWRALPPSEGGKKGNPSWESLLVERKSTAAALSWEMLP